MSFRQAEFPPVISPCLCFSHSVLIASLTTLRVSVQEESVDHAKPLLYKN